MQSALSIDIGGTTTKLAIVDEAFKLLDQLSLPTDSFKQESAFFEGLFNTCKTLIDRNHKRTEIVGIGIGAPCGIPGKGVIYQAANLPFSETVEIERHFRDHFQLPTFLTKDSYAAALGEGCMGVAKGMNDYFLLTLGTGLGCGIISNGQLLTGHNGQAGELGHTISIKNGRACNCGQLGCLETYVSASGLKRTVFQLMADRTEDSTLRSLSFKDITAKRIFEAAENADQLAIDAFELTGKILANKLAEMVAILEPEAIILAGGLAHSGHYLIQPLKRQLEQRLLKTYRGKVRILPSALGPNEAALIGAASIVWHKKTLSLNHYL